MTRPIAGHHRRGLRHVAARASLLRSSLRTLELSSLTSAVTYATDPILQSPQLALSNSHDANPAQTDPLRNPSRRLGASGYDEMADESWWMVLLRQRHVCL